jgi:hypothetical protein
MEEKNIYLDVFKDFDLTEYKKLGDIVYQVDWRTKQIIKLIVIGKVLNSSSNERAYQYHCVKFPYVIYVKQNVYFQVSKSEILGNNYFDTFEKAKKRLKEILSGDLTDRIKGIDELKEEDLK